MERLEKEFSHRSFASTSTSSADASASSSSTQKSIPSLRSILEPVDYMRARETHQPSPPRPAIPSLRSVLEERPQVDYHAMRRPKTTAKDDGKTVEKDRRQLLSKSDSCPARIADAFAHEEPEEEVVFERDTASCPDLKPEEEPKPQQPQAEKKKTKQRREIDELDVMLLASSFSPSKRSFTYEYGRSSGLLATCRQHQQITPDQQHELIRAACMRKELSASNLQVQQRPKLSRQQKRRTVGMEPPRHADGIMKKADDHTSKRTRSPKSPKPRSSPRRGQTSRTSLSPKPERSARRSRSSRKQVAGPVYLPDPTRVSLVALAKAPRL